MKKEILILGVGNDILTDDGVGIKLSREMQQRLHYDNITYDTLSIGGLDMLEYLQGYKTVIIIDAIKTEGGTPGTVYYFTPADFKETSNLSNIHDVSFLKALEIGKKLNMDIPENIHIIAVEILEDLTFSTEFTPEVQAKYPEAILKTQELIEDILG
ncbi:MAG: hydrogenase maturation protease [Bacteroidota bacterium]